LLLAGASNLTDVDCRHNQLTTLLLSNKPDLTSLYCAYNQLTSLSVATNTLLSYLYCSSNQLSSLDVSANTGLIALWCDFNQLTNLNIKNGNNVNLGLFAITNPNLTCIEVDNAAWSTANWTHIDAIASFSENCGVTGIDNTAIDKALMVYPNPTTGTVFVTEKGNLTLSDLSGKLLLEQKNTNQLDMSSLPAGIYLLHVGDKNQQTVKVIKE
jgi:hypothetical protein